MKPSPPTEAPPLVDHWQSALLLIRLVTGELVTGYYVMGAFSDERGTWLRSGFDAYVIKPELVNWWADAAQTADYLESL